MAATYLERLRNEIRSEVPERLLAQSHIDSLLLLYALLVATRGSKVTRADVHDAWVAWKVLNGEKHEAMVPFSQLAGDVRAEDAPFVEAIRRVAERRPS